MKVYIVRHGQSASNAVKKPQGGDSELTPLGIQQAKKLATRASRLHIDIIVSSDFARAIQTAEIIRKRVPKELIVASLLREEKHPSELTGKDADNPDAIRVKNYYTKTETVGNGTFPMKKTSLILKKG